MGCTSCGSDLGRTTPCPECDRPEPPGIPEDIFEAIDTIIAYNWEDEKEDYVMLLNAGTDPEILQKSHIFPRLVRVHNWLIPEWPEELPGTEEEETDEPL